MRRALVAVVALLLPICVWGQDNAPPPAASPPAAAPGTQLPTIVVPVPKPRPKRAAQAKRPPAKRAAPVRSPAPVRTTVPVRTREPAVPAPAGVGAPAGAPGNADDTIGASPVPGSAVPRDKVPSNAQVVTATAFDRARSTDFLGAVGQFLPFVSIGDQSGNQFQRDVNYRSFTASPVIGTPQGLAVYQNGVRINEVFGDTVNWDFIPDAAINRMELVPNNPVYGLNALGGAISLLMKNGFTYQGAQSELRVGAYGRTGFSAQAGAQRDGIAAYVAADSVDDQGWRQASPSRVRRLYTDVGARGEDGEFHLAFTAADNFFGATAATPIQLLQQNWASIYTAPQTTENKLAFLTSNLTYRPSDTLSLQAVLYFRGFWQFHVDGNGTNVQNHGCPDPTLLCFPNLDGTVSNLQTIGGGTVPATGVLANGVLGEIDRTATSANSYGGSFQAVGTDKVFGFDNHLVVGTSLDRGHVQFTSSG
jgi:iron complex outermembrane receptor protein